MDLSADQNDRAVAPTTTDTNGVVAGGSGDRALLQRLLTQVIPQAVKSMTNVEDFAMLTANKGERPFSTMFPLPLLMNGSRNAFPGDAGGGPQSQQGLVMLPLSLFSTPELLGALSRAAADTPPQTTKALPATAAAAGAAAAFAAHQDKLERLCQAVLLQIDEQGYRPAAQLGLGVARHLPEVADALRREIAVAAEQLATLFNRRVEALHEHSGLILEPESMIGLVRTLAETATGGADLLEQWRQATATAAAATAGLPEDTRHAIELVRQAQDERERQVLARLRRDREQLQWTRNEAVREIVRGFGRLLDAYTASTATQTDAARSLLLARFEAVDQIERIMRLSFGARGSGELPIEVTLMARGAGNTVCPLSDLPFLTSKIARSEIWIVQKDSGNTTTATAPSSSSPPSSSSSSSPISLPNVAVYYPVLVEEILIRVMEGFSWRDMHAQKRPPAPHEGGICKSTRITASDRGGARDAIVVQREIVPARDVLRIISDERVNPWFEFARLVSLLRPGSQPDEDPAKYLWSIHEFRRLADRMLRWFPDEGQRAQHADRLNHLYESVYFARHCQVPSDYREAITKYYLDHHAFPTERTGTCASGWSLGFWNFWRACFNIIKEAERILDLSRKYSPPMFVHQNV